jgi:hypothetical protein
MAETQARAMTLFLRWLLTNTLTAVGFTAAGILWAGRVDALGVGAKVSAGILVVFVVMSAYCGRLMWQADRHSRKPRELLHDAEHVEFSVSLLQILGLLGTVTGFLIAMVEGFTNLGGSGSDEIRGVLQAVADGSSTALVATLVGILCSVILGVQHHLLVNAISRR